MAAPEAKNAKLEIAAPSPVPTMSWSGSAGAPAAKSALLPRRASTACWWASSWLRPRAR